MLTALRHVRSFPFMVLFILLTLFSSFRISLHFLRATSRTFRRELCNPWSRRCCDVCRDFKGGTAFRVANPPSDDARQFSLLVTAAIPLKPIGDDVYGQHAEFTDRTDFLTRVIPAEDESARSMLGISFPTTASSNTRFTSFLRQQRQITVTCPCT